MDFPNNELIALGERSLDIIERIDAMTISSSADIERAHKLLLEAKSNIAAQEDILAPMIESRRDALNRVLDLKRERIVPIQERYDELRRRVGDYATNALKEDGEIVDMPKGMTAAKEYAVDIFDVQALCLAIGQGKVPADVIKGFYETKIKEYAKQGMEIDGCKVNMEVNVRVKAEVRG